MAKAKTPAAPTSKKAKKASKPKAAAAPTPTTEEMFPPVSLSDSVVLKEHELVPSHLVGHRALVINAPQDLVPMSQKDKTVITVRTRDQHNALLSIPLEAVELIRGRVNHMFRG